MYIIFLSKRDTKYLKVIEALSIDLYLFICFIYVFIHLFIFNTNQKTLLIIYYSRKI